MQITGENKTENKNIHCFYDPQDLSRRFFIAVAVYEIAVADRDHQRADILHLDSHEGSLERRRGQFQQISRILHYRAEQKVLHKLLLP